MTQREQILSYAADQLNTDAEYPFDMDNISAVLRHTSNRKWYALLMQIPASRLGLPTDEIIDVLNVKLEPIFIDGMMGLPGYHRAYHMNKRHWMTVRLDETLPMDEILGLLNMSFELTDTKKKKGVLSRCHDWLIPANPKYYDVEQAFREKEVIRWKQSSNISVGDTIYMYVAAPRSALLFRCRAEEVNLPYTFQRTGKQGNSMMIRLLETYDPEYMTKEILWNEYGVYSVRGPRSVPPALLAELRAHAGETGDAPLSQVKKQ